MESAPELKEIPKSNSNPNICNRPVDVKNNEGKTVSIPCGGKIMVWTLDNTKVKKTGTAIVHSRCGKCGELEEDAYNKPEIKHTERCLMGQKQKKVKPTEFLSTVIPDIHWKCVGVLSDEHRDDYECGVSAITLNAGFPY